MSKLKVTACHEEGMEVSYDFAGLSGGYQEEEVILFTINVAPSGLEASENFEDLVMHCQAEMNGLRMLKNLAKRLKGTGVSMDTDFYWNDQDLLVRIQIPIKHRFAKHLNLKYEHP